MKNPVNLEWRMYGLVPYNISPIQQAIQYGHAVQEYNNEMINYSDGPPMGNPKEEQKVGYVRDCFDIWRKRDKTFIILNGGTTNSKVKKLEGGGLKYLGSLNEHAHTIAAKGITTAEFYEPDLGDQLTSVVFLADGRVFDKETYPDYKFILETEEIANEFKNSGIKCTDYEDVISFLNEFEETKTKENYERWVDYIGGKENLWLRGYLKQFRLA